MNRSTKLLIVGAVGLFVFLWATSNNAPFAPKASAVDDAASAAPNAPRPRPPQKKPSKSDDDDVYVDTKQAKSAVGVTLPFAEGEKPFAFEVLFLLPHTPRPSPRLSFNVINVSFSYYFLFFLASIFVFLCDLFAMRRLSLQHGNPVNLRVFLPSSSSSENAPTFSYFE